jgi:hypothetical protein
MTADTKAAPLSDDDMDHLAQVCRTKYPFGRLTHGEVVLGFRGMESDLGQNFTPLPPPSTAMEIIPETEPEEPEEPEEPTPRRTRW